MSTKRPLFERFTSLATTLPHLPLGQFPTPVERLNGFDGMGALYVKRDDLSALAYGGNKVRKLEFLLAEAQRRGARTVLTGGRAGSHHAAATAFYARCVGLGCISLLLQQVNEVHVGPNLLLGYRCGAELCLYRNEAVLYLAAAAHLLRRALREGRLPMTIPAGGSSPLGIVGYVNAAFELQEQIADGALPAPDRVYVAAGSMGTAVGLALGLKAAGLACQVVAVRVAEEKYVNERGMRRLYRQTNALLRHGAPDFPDCSSSAGDWALPHDFYGPGYARCTPEGAAAMRRAAAAGVELEGTYTGKAMAALLSDASRGALKNQVVLFWNTFNSRDFSDRIAGLDYRRLPKGFHRYFETGYDRKS